MWEEAEIVVARQNQMLATGVGLFQMAVGSLFDKETGKALRNTIEGLADE